MRPSAEDLEILKSLPFFSGLDVPDIKALEPSIGIVCAQAGQQLFEQGNESNAFFVVLSGWLLLARCDQDGNRTAIKLIGPGESCAEPTLVEGARYPVSGEIVAPARIARIATSYVRNLIVERPGLGIAIISSTYRHLQGLLDRIEQGEGWPPHRRVAAFLLSYSRNKGQGQSFRFPLEQRLIAESLGMTASTFSRALAQLESVGVASNRGQITIDDPCALARIASGAPLPKRPRA